MPIHTHRSPRSAALAAASALALAGLLTACGGGDAKEEKSAAHTSDEVASVESPGSGTGKSEEAKNKSSDEGRPQWRIDSTQEEVTKLWDRYNACLKENGVQMTNARGGEQPAAADGEHVLTDPDEQKPKAAYDKCRNKMPMVPDELNKDKNPRYQQQLAASVKCMQNKGMKIVLGGKPGMKWTYTGEDGLSDTQRTTIERKCNLEAFGGKG